VGDADATDEIASGWYLSQCLSVSQLLLYDREFHTVYSFSELTPYLADPVP
jgi:hypothetical protein